MSADRLAAEAAALMADREPGDVQFDEESGEGDTIAVERDRDLALSAAARQSVAEIDAALQRLDNGTYGTTDDIYWTRDHDLFTMITSVPAFERIYLQAFQEAVDVARELGKPIVAIKTGRSDACDRERGRVSLDCQ